jgi:hypothetical protein
MIFNYNAPWHPLKSVYLGRSYPESFFRDIVDCEVRDLLQKISRETEEDFGHIERTLISLGVQVTRPEVRSDDSIMDYIDHNDQLTFKATQTFSLIPQPPMQPRDCQLIIGREFLSTNKQSSMFNLDQQGYFDTCGLATLQQFDAPLVTVIGKHLIVDQKDHPWLAKFIQQRFPDRIVIPVDIGGHNDAVFAPIKPGLLISSHHKNCYQDSFPNWEVYHLPDQSWNAMTHWRKIKHSNRGKWWIPGQKVNKDFCHFVNTWLSHWVGYAAETVFDVNMLVIDKKHVLVNNYHKGMFECLKKHQIEPIITPFRHRFFWDGGIHCVTSDFYRVGDADIYITYR